MFHFAPADRQEQASLIRPSAATGTNQSSQTASSSRTERSSKSKQSVSPRATTSGFSQSTGKAPCNDKALNIIYRRKENNFIIFSDSVSSLQAVKFSAGH